MDREHKILLKSIFFYFMEFDTVSDSETVTEPVVCAGTDEIQEELAKGRKKIEEIDGRLDNVETKVDLAIQHSAKCMKADEFTLIGQRLNSIFTLAKSTNDQVLDMTGDKATLQEQMGERVRANGKQDTKIAGIDKELAEIKESNAVLHTEMKNITELMGTIISILKAFGIGAAIALFGYFVKFIFGL